MTTDLAVREPTAVALSNDQLKYISGTEFVPPGLRGNLPAILACVATGRELGIGDMVALKSIHIIDGKATFSAELMVQLVRRNGHSITGEVGEGSATVRGKRADNGDEMTCTWTLQMAERAGLLGKSNWKKYPESMLWARAASQLCRMLFADCFAGATYTTEELGEEHTTEYGAPDPADGTPFGENPDAPPPADDPDDGKPATAAQRKKLDVLVKSTVKPPLRRLYATVAQMRAMLTDTLIADLGGIGDDQELHWSPLRDTLTKAEASALIDRLENLEPAA